MPLEYREQERKGNVTIDDAREERPVRRRRPTSSLRERRRLETTNEISDAALRLFEEFSVDGTTVADIAEAAGISQRTFFRYFPIKEAAAYTEEPAYAQALEEWGALPEPLENPFIELLDVLQAATIVMARPGATTRQVRVFRLERDNPGMNVGRLESERFHNERIRSVLRGRSAHKLTEYEYETMVRVARGLVDSAVFEWLSRTDKGDQVDLEAVFRHNREIVGLAILTIVPEGAAAV